MSASCASLSNGSRIYGKNGATPPYNKTRLRLALRWLCLYVLQNENENERSTLSLCHHNNSLSRTKVRLQQTLGFASLRFKMHGITFICNMNRCIRKWFFCIFSAMLLLYWKWFKVNSSSIEPLHPLNTKIDCRQKLNRMTTQYWQFV